MIISVVGSDFLSFGHLCVRCMTRVKFTIVPWTSNLKRGWFIDKQNVVVAIDTYSSINMLVVELQGDM